MEYSLEDGASGQLLATGASVLVAYNYRESATISIPDDWRQTITKFEGLEGSFLEAIDDEPPPS
jgi:acyl-CoA thioesterase FadM